MTTIYFDSGAKRIFATVLSTLILGACAGVPPPDTELATSRSAIEQAQTAGAAQQAPADFALARDKFARAEAAALRGENLAATRLAEQAQLDAQLAQARARAAGTERAVGELDESLRVLRDEMNRKP